MEQNKIAPNMHEMIEMCSDIKKICMPIFLYLNVRYFRIVRSYPDDTKFILCSNGFWLKQYFNEAYYNLELANYRKVSDNFNGVSMHTLTTNTQDPIMHFWSKLGPECDYNRVIAMFQKNKKYLECINFGLSQDTQVAQNIFLNNQNLFEHFNQYFYHKAKSLMQKAYELRFKVSITEEVDHSKNWLVGLPEDRQLKVLENMPLSEIYIGDNLTEPAISKMESKLIIHLIKGNDHKEILEKENISKEELDTMFKKIMEKLGVKSEKEIKRQLFVRKLIPKLRLLS